MPRLQLSCSMRGCIEMDYFDNESDLPRGWQLINGRPFCGEKGHGAAAQVALKERKFVIEVDPMDRRHLVLRATGEGDVSAFLDGICK